MNQQRTPISNLSLPHNVLAIRPHRKNTLEHDQNLFVVLRVFTHANSYTPTEYVTHVMNYDPDIKPHSVYVWGHYFTDYAEAMQDFCER